MKNAEYVGGRWPSVCTERRAGDVAVRNAALHAAQCWLVCLGVEANVHEVHVVGLRGVARLRRGRLAVVLWQLVR